MWFMQGQLWLAEHETLRTLVFGLFLRRAFRSAIEIAINGHNPAARRSVKKGARSLFARSHIYPVGTIKSRAPQTDLSFVLFLDDAHEQLVCKEVMTVGHRGGSQ